MALQGNYDAARKRMVVVAGWGFAYFNDAWAFSLTGNPAWSGVAAMGNRPDPRLEHTTIYDPVRDRILLFGGKDQSQFFNDTWELRLGGTPVWSTVATQGAPPSPRESRAVYDPLRDRLVIFGGFGTGSGHLNETWTLSLQGTPTWQQLATQGTPPPPRRGHATVYDPARDRLVVFGGYDDVRFYDDVWALSLSGTPTWEEIHPQGTRPPPRYGHMVVYDSMRERLVVFGGFNGAYLNDSWVLNLSGTPTWEFPAVSGAPPGERDFAAVVYDPNQDRMVLFGGNIGCAVFNDAWALRFHEATPALIALVEARAYSDHVRLVWRQTSGLDMQMNLYRREPGKHWDWLSLAVADGSGQIAWEDHGVLPGRRYAYGLGIEQDGQPRILSEVWLDVPGTAVLALHGPAGNPSDRDLLVSFSLPDGNRATVELFDLRGRLVVAKDVGSLGPGNHTVPLGHGQSLRAGLYFVRLRQGGPALTAKAPIVH